MKVRAQFFSRLREETGVSETEIELPNEATVNDLLVRLFAGFPKLERWNAHLLIAVGVEYVSRDQILKPNDHVAIMPPVQGG
jgi:molybdopterin converting factor subunit 1